VHVDRQLELLNARAYRGEVHRFLVAEGARAMASIRVKRGMTLGIPVDGLVISTADGGLPSMTVTLHTKFDVCPTWVQLALRHLREAKTAEAARRVAWASADEAGTESALDAEFEAAMQAIVSAAIALDAFYASVTTGLASNTTKSTERKSPDDRWRKRAARYAQIAETLRVAFGLNKEGFADLRQKLKQIYRCRDLAVHPSPEPRPAEYHPDFDAQIEWRFVLFVMRMRTTLSAQPFKSSVT